ncbi:MAG: hypothetical protein FWH36_08945 [Lentimicrobiaceae bacterium]|nr:hypothetical protein [Lentimicrobiaceae bacterium]
MTNRKLKEIGLYPVVAYLLVAGLFLAVSALLFHRVDYAQYLYLAFPLPFFSRLSDRQRNDFLKMNLRERQYKTIRLIENLLIALPFALFLCWRQCFLAIVPLIAISILFSWMKVKKMFSFVLPTPFYKHPFEFSVGFRNTFYLFPIIYYLSAMAIVHDNFNLGVVTLGFMLIVCCAFYFRADNIYHIWIFNLSPSRFLFYKIKKAISYTLLLCAPILLSLSVFYFLSSWILLLGFLLGCVFLAMVIFIKYAAFPDDIGVGETLLLVISVLFPPILFIMIFYFRKEAIEKLNTVLE